LTIAVKDTVATPLRSSVRPEIQALRAIAVVSVVLYHLWPTRVPGGFVGVDIFFAISGFLIIGHLLREVDQRGRIRLIDFWARRARRLLPASLLVLVVTAIATIIWVPTVLWQQFFSEIGASALYAENWLLARNAVDYLAAANTASPVEHFWSLSVEEQYYIAWPLILIIVLAIARLIPRIRTRWWIAAALVGLSLLSFVYSVHDVAKDPAQAYFVTPSRAWEFGLGGIVAFFGATPLKNHDRLRSALSWLGLLVIATILAVYTPSTPFPGAAALPPVAGTLLVIWAGVPDTRWAPSSIMKVRPIQWLGDVSYSLYLWHWPPIVLLPFIVDHALTAYLRVSILVFALLAAGLTKTFVEDPARNGRLLASRPSWVSLVSTLALTALVAAGCGLGLVQTQNLINRAAAVTRAAVDRPRSCIGISATQPGSICAKPYAVTSLTNPAFAETDIGKGVQSIDPCKQLSDTAKVMVCREGDTTAPTTTWALIGDSHAGQYLEALDLYGKSHHIEVLTYLKSWCSGTGASKVSTSGDDDAIAMSSCATWGRNVLAQVGANRAISTVIYTNYTRTYLKSPSNIYGRAITTQDFSSAWNALITKGKHVVAMRDLPSAGDEDLPACIAENLSQYDPCALPRDTATLAVADDPMLAAVRATKGVGLVDLTDDFCGPVVCHPLIGGLIVNFGSNHMSATFSRTLAPYVGAAIEKASGT
jgi:peptidoglycan/LPS O-acetylase OafA/YrhL